MTFFIKSLFFGGLFCLAGTGDIVTQAAGRVGDHVVTSREVVINSLIEDALYRSKAPKQIQSKPVKSREFVRETTGVLLEWAIFREGEDLSNASESDQGQQAKLFKRAKRVLRRSQAWQEAGVQDAELKAMLLRKTVSKRLIETRLGSTNIPITDKEAREYFKANLFKFEELPFEKLKANIKQFLRKQQTDRRMREWFELLQIKYRVRNFLAEDRS